MEREIVRTMNDVVNVIEDDEELEITRTHYPIPPYGNHVMTGIVLRKKPKVIKVYRVRQSWDGTGSDNIVYVELDEVEFQQLVDAAREVKDVDGFNLLTNRIQRLQEKIDGEVEDKLREVVNALKQLQLSADLCSLLNDRDRVLEALEQYVDG